MAIYSYGTDAIAEVAERPRRPEVLHARAQLMEHHAHRDEPVLGFSYGAI